MIWFLVWAVLAAATAKWLRHWLPWFQRLNDCNWQLLLLVDIIVAFCIGWPLYLLGVLNDRPLAWTTISTMCGYYALQDRAWAKLGSKLIDSLFLVLTEQDQHCLKSYLNWSDPLGQRSS